ncbi:MAG TPA: ABC transporter permease [Vicinamibacterales bacterium]|nr:ABC transporter permease [Vicinamibacterales bacterium]
MLNDVRVGLRLLWKDKVFTLTSVLTLALCIGANTALFSVVHNVILKPLPVPESDRIVLMGNHYPGAGADDAIGYSGVPDYYDRLRDVAVLDPQALYNTNSRALDENGTPTRVRAQSVTTPFFRLLGVKPAVGRDFADEDGEVGANRKVILSHALWQTLFAGDTGAIGKDVRLDDVAFTVIGVMPRGFTFVDPDVMLWTPLAFTPDQKSDAQRHSNNFQNIGRLKPGASVDQAQQQVNALNAANLDRFPQYRELLINAGFHTTVTRLQETLVHDIRPTLYLMWGGALFVLLIGCVNVANLVLVRSRVRLKELATRLALGATRWRVGRQLAVESVLLTLVSGALGLALGAAVLRLFGAINISDLPRGSEIRLDGVVVASTAVSAIAIGLVLGLIPAASVIPGALTAVLREEGRGGTAGRGARVLRRTLVVAQVAFAFVLLVGAGLLFASFRRVLAVDPGFRPDGVLTASIELPRSRYGDDARLTAFTSAALDRLRALPGVSAVGATDWIPMNGNNNDSVILAEGYQMKPGESLISPNQAAITPGYFEAIGARLARGRLFDERDTPSSLRVVIVDEKLARHFWPNQDPIGRRMFLPQDINNLMAITDKTVFLTVVGVVKDVKLHSFTEEQQPLVGAYYFPMSQSTRRGLSFALRTAGDPVSLAGGVRGALKELDRQLPVFDVKTLDARMDKALVVRRSPMLLSMAFGAVALALSAIGIYGVLAYLVTQRTREIGIRLALGSSAGRVFELVLREGLGLVGAGFVLGGIGALALRKSLESQLFGVRATDPLVLGTVVASLAIVALAACAVPARRATRIDPIVALTE